MKKKRIVLISLLLAFTLILLTSCSNVTAWVKEEWEKQEYRIGRDTADSWKNGRIQMIRGDNYGMRFCLEVDNKVTVNGISDYRSDGSRINMVTGSILTVFDIESETERIYGSIESIPDPHEREVFSSFVSN